VNILHEKHQSAINELDSIL